MNLELRELYQDVILDHNRRPRNFRVIDGPVRQAVGYNPLCGDRVTVYLEIVDGVVRDVAFQGRGCAISTASASLMTESVKGLRVEEAEALFQAFHHVVTGDTPPDLEALDRLAPLAGVSEFPARVKCASLAWHTLRAALKEGDDLVSTE